jgi:hypothetical protein
MVVKRFPNGDVYDGEWEDGMKQGQGTLTYAQGGSYEGEWSNNMRNGYGVNEWPNGDRYAGHWDDNKRHGKGKFTYSDGGKYNGEWENDMRSGKGVNVWANGNQYDGSWEDNQQNGHGTFTYADGGSYVGDWSSNMRHGNGVNKWANGDRYEGSWKYNKKHGKGTLYHKDGTKQEGNWTDDELDSGSNQALTTSHGKGDNGKNKIQFKGVWLNGQPCLVLLLPKASGCSYQALAREFIASLKWKQAFFDDANDRCYCSRCYKESWNDVIAAGDSKYVIPRGWVRLGLLVDPVIAKAHDIWNKWIVTYHGTTKIAAESIIAHRQFCMPGDVLIDGTQLAIRPGHIPDQNFVYTSPTIAYSSGPVYSPVYNFHSTENNSNYEAQIVLHCRQMPNTFQVGPETIGAKGQICSHIPNSEIEYFTNRRGTIVAYGLLVRFRPKNA